MKIHYLINSVVNNDFEKVKKLLQYQNKYFNINSKNNYGKTALFYVNKYDMANLLLYKGANVNILDNNNNTAIINIIGFKINNDNNKEKVKIIKLLIDNGANIHIKNKEGNDAYLHACCYLNYDIIKLLLNRGANINSKNLITGNTSLMNMFNKDIIKLLLNYGININIKNNEGNTVLMLFCKYNLIDLIKLLLKYNVDVNNQNNLGETALMISCGQYNYDTNIEIIKLLLSYSANPNIKNNNGENCMMLMYKEKYSFYLSDQNNLNLLLDHGVNIEHQNNIGENVLMLACNKLDNDAINFFVDKININLTNNECMTPLMIILSKIIKLKYKISEDNFINCIISLIPQNINNVDINNKNALIYLCDNDIIHENKLFIVNELISRGIYINQVDNNKCNSLSYACKYNYLDLIIILVKNNITINFEDKYILKYIDIIIEILNTNASNIFSDIVLLSDNYLDFIK